MPELQKAQQGSTHLSQGLAEHRKWIGGRIVTLLSHYWREDDPVELTAAIGRDWADVLEGLPQEYIQLACVQYQRDEARKKPTPGAIYQIARALMPKPQLAHGEEAEAILRALESPVPSVREHAQRMAEKAGMTA